MRPARMKLTRSPKYRRTWLELRAGMDIWRYFTIESKAGHGEYSVELDPAPFVGLRAIFRL